MMSGSGSANGRHRLVVVNLAQLDVAEPHGISMILQRNVAFLGFAELFPTFELALGKFLVPIFAPHFHINNFLAVEPMFDVVLIDQDTCCVPLANRFYGFHIRGVHRVKGAG